LRFSAKIWRELKMANFQFDIKPIKIIGANQEIHFMLAYRAYIEFQSWRFRHLKSSDGKTAAQKITIYDKSIFKRVLLRKKRFEIFTHETNDEFVVEIKDYTFCSRHFLPPQSEQEYCLENNETNDRKLNSNTQNED